MSYSVSRKVIEMSETRDRIRVHIQGMEYNIVGGSFQEMLAAVKQIVGRRFVSELKVWQLPGTFEEIQNQLGISGYELAGGTPLEKARPSGQAAPARTGSDRIRLKVGEHQLAVVGGSFQEMLTTVKGLPGRRFDGNAKIWEIPGDVSVIKGLVEAAGFQLEGAENISQGPIRPMETPLFSGAEQPPPFEPPDFLDEKDVPAYEPPDWWDDAGGAPPPGVPDDWDDRFAAPAYDEPPNCDDQPLPQPGTASAGTGPTAAGRRDQGDQIRIRLGEVSATVSGGSFQEMLTAIKNIPGRRFNSQEKVWELPESVTLDSADRTLRAAGFVMKVE